MNIPSVLSCIFCFLIHAAEISAASTIQFNVTNATISELDVDGIYVSIEFPPNAPHHRATVSVTGGTATPGKDFILAGYNNSSSTNTVLVDSVANYIRFIPIDDGNPESDETVILGITGVPAGMVVGENSSLFITIRNGVAQVVAESDQTLWMEPDYESESHIPLTFTRRGDTNMAVTVDVEVSGTVTPGDDFPGAIPASLTFPAGQRFATNSYLELDIRDGRVDSRTIENLSLIIRDTLDTNRIHSRQNFEILDREKPSTLDYTFRSELPISLIKFFGDNTFISLDYSTPEKVHLLNLEGSTKGSLTPSLRPVGFARQFNDRMLIAGFDPSVARFTMIRITTDGTLDSTFRSPPILTSPVFGQPYLITSASGHIYVIGAENLLRFAPDGSPDPLFKPSIPLPIEKSLYAADLEGRLIASPAIEESNPINHRKLLRLNGDGSIDSAFATTFTRSNGDDIQLTQPIFQPDGKILIGGSFDMVNGQNSFGLVRLHPDGSIDGSFSLERDPGRIDSIYGLPDGTILTGGFYSGIHHISPNGVPIQLLPIRTVERICFPPSIEIVSVWQNYVYLKGEAFDTGACEIASFARFNLNSLPHTAIQVSECSYNSESDESAWIRVSRLGDVTAPAQISYATRDGTAIGGNDYKPIQGVLQFSPFQHELWIQIPLLDDTELEGDETLELAFWNAEGIERYESRILVHIVDNETGFTAESVKRLPSGAIELNYQAIGLGAVLQYSADLRTWQPAQGAIEHLPGNRFRFTDTGVANQAKRFYRMVTPARVRALRIQPNC